MYSTVRTAVLDGISAIPVQVEVDISTGMPVFRARTHKLRHPLHCG